MGRLIGIHSTENRELADKVWREQVTRFLGEHPEVETAGIYGEITLESACEDYWKLLKKVADKSFAGYEEELGLHAHSLLLQSLLATVTMLQRHAS
jgi:hypothetical protein